MLHAQQYTPMDSGAIIEAPEAMGWRPARITGPYHHFRHPTRPGFVAVPHPREDIPPGTLRSIGRRTGERIRR
jgi:predicted RNA binding protein YcfA (HicA-like mRNA interferase family)